MRLTITTERTFADNREWEDYLHEMERAGVLQPHVIRDLRLGNDSELRTKIRPDEQVVTTYKLSK